MTTNESPSGTAGAPESSGETGSDPTARLSRHHADMLATSGITPEHAATRGYETITDPKRLAELKIVNAARNCVPGLLVPQLRADGSTWGWQYRPDNPRLRDGKAVKYETPWQQRNGLDVPPGVGPKLADPKEPLWITEGVRKADCGALHGLCIVALSGVWNWLHTNKAGGKMALPEFRDIALNGRRVIIAFDGDVARKPARRSPGACARREHRLRARRRQRAAGRVSGQRRARALVAAIDRCQVKAHHNTRTPRSVARLE